MSNERFTKWIEGNGLGLRKYLGLTPYEVLDPFELSKSIGVHVISLKDAKLPKEVTSQLLIKDSKCWDAGCIKLPNDSALILYNPTHAPTRIRATIMEELAHLHLNHKGSRLSAANDGICCRSYKPSEEKQAYAVGSAALIPSALLKKARGTGITRYGLAQKHGVSEQLVSYRENITKIRLS